MSTTTATRNKRKAKKAAAAAAEEAKSQGGRPPFVPTDEQRRTVKTAAAFLQHEKICKLVINPTTGNPIDKHTLEEHFRTELDVGMASAHYCVGKSLYDQAVGVPQFDDAGKQIGWISEPDKIAAIWFSKAQMGWKEQVDVLATGGVRFIIDGAPEAKLSRGRR